MSPDFWRGKTVFITGSTGFKGAWLCEVLIGLGATVVGYALRPSPGAALFRDLALSTRVLQHTGDVRDLDALSEAVQHARPDVIFHLAAQALVREGYADPVRTYSTNVMGTVNLLEAVRTSRLQPIIVNITTDKVYRDEDGRAHTEDEALGGHAPYSASKAASEIVTRAAYLSWARQREIGVATARAGNVIGGGDWAEDRLIPDCVRAVMSNAPVCIRSPIAVRPWQHVLEALVGYLSLAEALATDPKLYSRAWNFGPLSPDDLRVADVARRVLTVLNRPDLFQLKPDKDGPKEVPLLRLNSEAAHTKLGWSARWTPDEAVERTARWYGDFIDGAPATMLVQREIAAYLTD